MCVCARARARDRVCVCVVVVFFFFLFVILGVGVGEGLQSYIKSKTKNIFYCFTIEKTCKYSQWQHNLILLNHISRKHRNPNVISLDCEVSVLGHITTKQNLKTTACVVVVVILSSV